MLTTGCDKTTPACIMAAATVDIPAIVLSGGPMLNGWWKGERTGSGTIVWKARERLAAGEIDYDDFIDIVASSAPSVGHCNTMGTASTMNSLAEALGMSLPGCAAIPAPYRERGQIAYETGKRIVDMVWEDLKPSDILTREAFENAIVVNSAIGGSTNAPIHINAIARHIGVELDIEDWETVGHKVPLLVNLQPAGKYLGEEYHRAGGVPAVVNELMKQGLIHEDAMTANGKTMGENCRGREIEDKDVIRPFDDPLVEDAGFIVLKGNLFDSAIMKTSVISEEFRDRYLSNPKSPNAFEGRAIVFDGPEDYHHRIDDPALQIDENCMLFIRGTGPIGYPGGAEVVNMQPPAALIKRGIHSLPCIGDGRQSGTSGSPSILNASPEAAAGGGLALLKTGDRVRIDLNNGEANILISDEELAERRADLDAHGGFPFPEEPDALAGDPARHGRPVLGGHGAEAGDQVPARRPDHGHPARQPLRSHAPGDGQDQRGMARGATRCRRTRRSISASPGISSTPELRLPRDHRQAEGRIRAAGDRHPRAARRIPLTPPAKHGRIPAAAPRDGRHPVSARAATPAPRAGLRRSPPRSSRGRPPGDSLPPQERPGPPPD